MVASRVTVWWRGHVGIVTEFRKHLPAIPGVEGAEKFALGVPALSCDKRRSEFDRGVDGVRGGEDGAVVPRVAIRWRRHVGGIAVFRQHGSTLSGIVGAPEFTLGIPTLSCNKRGGELQGGVNGEASNHADEQSHQA